MTKNMQKDTAYNSDPGSGPACGGPAQQTALGYYDELCKQMDENTAQQVFKALCAILDNAAKIVAAIIDEFNAIAAALINADISSMKEAFEKLLEEISDLPYTPKRKLPRPPRYLGPVNKANYTANRPMRRARSNCYTRRRAVQ